MPWALVCAARTGPCVSRLLQLASVPSALVHFSTRVAALSLLVLLGVGTSVRAAPALPQGVLIDVPYLAQTPQLCGGAALAMVLRYWGATAVPQDFQHLVDDTAGGIATSRLTSAASERGWRAVATGAPEVEPIAAVAAHINQGRPVIVLLEDSATVHHYVVVVGVTPADVVLHDPARAPYTVMSHEEFSRRWNVTSRWMLLVLPADETSSAPAPGLAATLPTPTSGAAATVASASPLTPPSTPGLSPASGDAACSALVAEGVTRAQSGLNEEAEAALLSAISLCPAYSGGYRELAGLRLLQKRWAESAALAAQAVERNPGDEHAWELLATNRFVAGDVYGALDAWNRIGQPQIDTVAVEGLRRTAHPIVTSLLGLKSGELLRADAFRRATRRLEDFPTTSLAVLRYAPTDGGKAAVSAYVNERPRLPTGWIAWTSVAARAAIAQDIRVDVAALASQGDLWTPSYRWPPLRPRVGLQLSLPTPGTARGIIRMEAFWERQTYERPLAGIDRFREERRRVSAGYSDWITGAVRLQVGAASDRMAGHRYVAVEGGATTRLFRDHVALFAHAELWRSRRADVAQFSSYDVTTDWRSTTDIDAPVWSVRSGIAIVSDAAPLALWPGAGSTPDRGILLRARPLVHRQVISGEVFGRRLGFATIERQQVVYRSAYGRLAVAGFADAARAWRRLDDATTSRLHVDVGVGIRVDRPGDASQVRVDVGVGLRDAGVRLSAGYVTGWGRK